MATLTTGIMFLLFSCVHFLVWGTFQRWSACGPTAYGVVRDFRKFTYSALPQERTPGTHWTGGWVGLRAGLDTEAREKILLLFRGSNPDRPVCSQTLY
jgi:hypothetical protein